MTNRDASVTAGPRRLVKAFPEAAGWARPTSAGGQNPGRRLTLPAALGEARLDHRIGLAIFAGNGGESADYGPTPVAAGVLSPAMLSSLLRLVLTKILPSTMAGAPGAPVTAKLQSSVLVAASMAWILRSSLAA